VAQLKILVFATENTPFAARIAIALANVGFHVAALTRNGHPVREARAVECHFAYHPTWRSKSIICAIERWYPDLLACTDDTAVRELQGLHKLTAASDDRARRRITVSSNCRSDPRPVSRRLAIRAIFWLSPNAKGYVARKPSFLRLLALSSRRPLN
jgi:hypothetical protein